MKIINLVEDTQGDNGCIAEHGLSFYIETAQHKLLLDTGATDAFLFNAERLGIDLGLVDTVIISHGHYDHAGGLLAFASINPHARIYIHRNAVGEFYNLKNGKTKYIGMDPAISALEQVIFVNGNMKLDDELSLFCNVQERLLWPRGNAVLKKKCKDAFIQDEFDHEQYLVVTEGEKRVLLSGCAHNGILNILETYHMLCGEPPTHVISGFHTVKQEYTEEDDAIISQTAHALAKTDACYYSGHCTGEHAMRILKRIMGDRLTVLHSGDEIL